MGEKPIGLRVPAVIFKATHRTLPRSLRGCWKTEALMGPIRRSRKRKSEPEPAVHPPAAELEARGSKPVRFLVRASERLRTPPQPRASVPTANVRTPPQSRATVPQSHQVRGRRRQRVPRRVYRFLADLSSSDSMACYKRGKKVVDKNVRETSRSVATSEELINAENDNGKEVSNDPTGFQRHREMNTLICRDSAPLKDDKGLHESNVQDIIPSQMMVGIHELYQDNYIGTLKGATEYTTTSDNPLDSNVFLSNSPNQYGNNGTRADKCATSMEQDISEESFEQYLVMDDGANDDFMPSIKSCQAIQNPRPGKDNVEAVMDCETNCVVATESMAAMPLVMINEAVPNLFSSNTTSGMGKADHQEFMGVPCIMVEHRSADIPFSAISLPAFEGGTSNTQSSTKKFADEENQGTSREHHASPMTEHAAESSQSIGKSVINQLVSTDMKNAEAEHGNKLTVLEYTEGTMSKCVASETDDSYCPLLQRSLVIHETKITDLPLEPLVIENSPFVKTLPMWAHIEEMEIFKEVPQRPHFHPFKRLGVELCESMALGLMVFFTKTAESIKNLNIQDDNELFKEKMKGLCLLEEHGFDVGHLRSRLETLLHMKNSRSELLDAIKKLEEKITLKEMDGRHRGTQIGMIYTTVRQLERQAKLFRCILKSSVSQQKTDALEISRLKTEACDLEQLYQSVEQQFSSVIAAPWNVGESPEEKIISS